MKVALYARVSTAEQTVETQLLELRRFIQARGWTVYREFLDEGISGGKERRPALDGLLKDARRRRVDTICVWSLDRLGRSLKHLVTILDEFQALGISFISLKEGLDWSTPTGKLQAQILAVISEFERARIAERVTAGLARVRKNGQRLGRPEKVVPESLLAPVRGLPVREAAEQLGVSLATAYRWLSQQTS